MQNGYKDHLKLLQWIAALVLLVACANIANLLLVRGVSRKAELSIRSALGAQRSRIVRQLLTESVLLSSIGGLLGLAVSYLGAHALLALAFPGQHNMPINAAPSPLVIGFAFVLSLATGVLFGLAPAMMAARTQPAEALRANARTTALGASLLQRALVVLQAALSLVLLVAAGLFAQSLNKAENVDMKLDATNRYIVHINPQAAGYKNTEVEPLYQAIEDRFHAIPGVLKVGLATYTPMEENNWGSGVKIQGEPDLNKGASWVKGSPEYFDSVGTRVVMGRGFTPQDTLHAAPVAVVNQEFVKQFFGKRNPIGHRFGFSGPVKTPQDGAHEIVGVVEDTTYTTVYWKNHAMYFLPLTQPAGIPGPDNPLEKDQSMYAGAIVIQAAHSIPGFEKIIGDTLASINPNLTIVKFQTFQQQIDDRFIEERLIARLTSLFGLLALLLAAIGLYGVTAHTVVRRTPEIGIRMALGAARTRVIGTVVRGAMLQAVTGLAIGVPVAIFCVRYVKSQLYEITSVSVPVMTIAIAVLVSAAAIAGLIPALRAASIDPYGPCALSEHAPREIPRRSSRRRFSSVIRHAQILEEHRGLRTHTESWFRLAVEATANLRVLIVEDNRDAAEMLKICWRRRRDRWRRMAHPPHAAHAPGEFRRRTSMLLTGSAPVGAPRYRRIALHQVWPWSLLVAPHHGAIRLLQFPDAIQPLGTTLHRDPCAHIPRPRRSS